MPGAWCAPTTSGAITSTDRSPADATWPTTSTPLTSAWLPCTDRRVRRAGDVDSRGRAGGPRSLARTMGRRWHRGRAHDRGRRRMAARTDFVHQRVGSDDHRWHSGLVEAARFAGRASAGTGIGTPAAFPEHVESRAGRPRRQLQCSADQRQADQARHPLARSRGRRGGNRRRPRPSDRGLEGDQQPGPSHCREHQRGIASRGYRPGPYAPGIEAGAAEFTEWYSDTLLGALRSR